LDKVFNYFVQNRIKQNNVFSNIQNSLEFQIYIKNINMKHS